MAISEIDQLIQLLAKLPGLGPRSARRAVLHLLKRREGLMAPLAKALAETAENVRTCSTCGNLDTVDPCGICTDARRDASILCVVEDVADLWALERTAAFRGRYHVLGGTLSALDGIGPDELNIPKLVDRARRDEVSEVILATSATVEGQTTATTSPNAWAIAASRFRASPTACRSAANSTTSTTAPCRPPSRRAGRFSRQVFRGAEFEERDVLAVVEGHAGRFQADLGQYLLRSGVVRIGDRDDGIETQLAEAVI